MQTVLCHMGNWDLVQGVNGSLIAKGVHNGAATSSFGDRKHVASLINLSSQNEKAGQRGYRFDVAGFTESGIEAFAGLHSVVVFTSGGVCLTRVTF